MTTGGGIWEVSLTTAILAGTPLLYAALGELLSEKVGVVNIGLEGIMLVGAAGGIVVAFESGSALAGFLASAGFGVVFTMLTFTLPVVVMGASQVLAGFGIWLIGTGLSGEVGQNVAGDPLPHAIGFAPARIPLLAELPYVGSIVFSQIWPVYLGAVLALAGAFLLGRTRHGLNMRAIGEDPAAAHSVGIAVRNWQAFYSCVCGALTGAAGGLLAIGISRAWQEQMVAGRGWIALALVMFAGWRAVGLIWTSYLVGVLLILGNVGQAQGWGIPSSVLGMAPYVLTVAILMIRGWRELGKSDRSLAPAALGITFRRGQRGMG